MIKNILFGFIILVSFNSCLKSSHTNTCVSSSYNPCTIQAPASEIQAVQNYLTANGITASQQCSGLFYKVINPGTGTSPDICSTVTVTYEGRLESGLLFDQSSSPVQFSLSSLITGWKDGIPLVKPGGRIYLYVPPTLGYGSNPNGSIPGNSILIFTIDLIAVQ